MKKYYFNDGAAQLGPFTIEELQSKNITADTPVWYDGLPEWTTAGQVAELNDIIIHTPPPYHSPSPGAEETKPETNSNATLQGATISPVADSPEKGTAVPTTTAKSSNKKTAWLSWVLYLLILGGAAYFIYQDMEKNKANLNNGPALRNTAPADTTDAIVENTAETQPANMESHDMVLTTEESATKPGLTTAPATTSETKGQQPPVVVKNKTTQPAVVNENAKSKTAIGKTQPTAAQKKAEEEKKMQQDAIAAAAIKEKEYRNNWPKYIIFGKLDFNTEEDKIQPFNVPVYNGTNIMIDKVIVRVDYMKRDKKVVNSETITIYNIPPGSGVNGKAVGSKKGNNVKAFITGISSRKLHFCYPQNNGNADDPYYCNQ